jgi:DNA-binding transcriptional LysR family regulator
MSQVKVNLLWMRHFLVVAAEGSFTRAAGRLQIDSSGLFRRIDVMEDRLEVKLFERFAWSVSFQP